MSNSVQCTPIAATSPAAPPPTIESLPGLLYIEPQNPPGVYFLCRSLGVVYIGKSVSPVARITAHIQEAERNQRQGLRYREFDSAFLLPCDLDVLEETEGALIRHFRPEYNGDSGRGERSRDAAIITGLGIAV